MNKQLSSFLVCSLLLTAVAKTNMPIYAADIIADAITVETSLGGTPYGSINVNNAGVVNNSIAIKADSIILQTVNDVIQNSGTITTTSLNNSGVIAGYNNVLGSFSIDGNSTNDGQITQANLTLGHGKGIVDIVNNGVMTSTAAFTNYSNLTGNQGVLNIAGGSNISGSITQATINIQDAYTNNAPLNATTGLINSGGITNNNDIVVNNLTNNGAIEGDSGNLIIENGGINNEEITQNNITIGGSFENNKTLEAKNAFTNNGTIQNNSMIKTDVLTNNATIAGSSGTLLVSNGGTSIGSIVQNNISIGGVFENKGTMEAISTFVNTGSIANSSDIKVGELTNTGKLLGNSGTLTINNGGINSALGEIVQRDISIKGTFENTGTIVAENSLINGGRINNLNTITTNVFTNSGTITGETGSLNILNGGKNTGTISQKDFVIGGGDFTNNGTITVLDSFNNNTLFEGTGTLNIKGGGENNNTLKQNNLTFTGTDKTFTNNSIISLTGKLTNSGANVINKSTITVGALTNSGTIEGNGSITISGNTSNSNSGKIIQNAITNNGTFTNSSTAELVSSTLTNRGSITNSGVIGNTNTVVTNYGSITNSKDFFAKTLNNTSSGSIVNNSSLSTTSTFTNTGTLLNNKKITTGAFVNNGVFTNSGVSSTLDTANFTNNKEFILDNGAQASLRSISNNASTGIITIKNGSSLILSNQTGEIKGTINAIAGKNTMNLGNGIGASGVVNIGDSLTSSILNFTGGNITQTAELNINYASQLVINNATSNVYVGDNDTYNGGIVLKNGNINFDSQTVVAKDITKGTPEQPYYNQSGGVLNLKNSTLIAENNSITGGDINLDSLSIYTSKNGGFYLNNFKASGEMQAMNTINEDFRMTNMVIGDSGASDNQLDLTLDIYGRSNDAGKHGSDRFIAENIVADAGLDSAIINVKDWTLSGDVLGLDAPIDRHVKLGNIFAGNIADNIGINVKSKEVFTPIGWYELKNNGGILGNYSLSLTRYNSQVFRGQVATVSQYMNQLLVNDTLFNHSMLLPSIKDGNNRTINSNSNKYASISPIYAPYQYTADEGGLWYKMYGAFEKLQMNRFSVDNNAYGSLVGADLGLVQSENGWHHISTAYIGYNGGHQTYGNDTSMYQNGGQVGFLRTWYKNGLVIGGLLYGGLYQNDMDVAGRSENSVNYYIGTSAKTAYNLRLNDNWVVQPNLMMAYNLFGQQNWHSNYGEMSMMSGFLNGFNVAPGVNFIWEKETFSIYAALQYLFNIAGSSDGRAGNVSLPSMSMERGYLQYGLGINKSLTDRSSGYVQTMFRNVGRTGVGFQLGFKYLLGL